MEGTVKGELKVLKQDKYKAPIANVKFKLSKKDGSVVKDNQKEIEIIRYANGIANIKALPSGDYILKKYRCQHRIHLIRIKNIRLL
ncbi:MSCRAMM family protein [Staphylococcus aureus]